MSDKEYKTINEQLNILKSRGLTIDDESKAADFLIRNNYYRISGLKYLKKVRWRFLFV